MLTLLKKEAASPVFTCQAATAAAKSLQSCPTLCDPIDDSPPGSAVPGILQARTLEWVSADDKRKKKGSKKVLVLTQCDEQPLK